ncbi:MAG: tyrosine--tRNA ligase [Candidatus Cloacimonetes bacterium]|nr:tyrosine--tRNA ligase [Candidatus Cloacimonadota bacterium]MBS3766791.1 tyrosine--tRNA ligase [Candidatus Cloacimonadota bacterium]
MDIKSQLGKIKIRTEEIIPEEELVEKLKKSKRENRPLNIKLGIDPTSPDIHIGHIVAAKKMRDFQDLGHKGIIIIGDFTAQIGDPTGKDKTRQSLNDEQVKKNAEKYMDQLYKVLDEEKTEVKWQTSWFDDMTLAKVMKLMSRFTLAKFMEHDTFRRRYEEGLPLSLHEILYPILQAYDSIMINADIELGATEQKFNILTGRRLQQMMDQEPQVAILMPILIGTDGTEKMSKSLDNYIAVFDTPKEKYGKVMSIPDSVIVNYYKYAAFASREELKKVKSALEDKNVNPKKLKMELARKIVSLYDGEEAAKQAEKEFEKVFAKNKLPKDMPVFTTDQAEMWIVKLVSSTGLVDSNSEARRMIKQGAVSIDDEKITKINIDQEIEDGMVLRVGKRRFCKIKKK